MVISTTRKQNQEEDSIYGDIGDYVPTLENKSKFANYCYKLQLFSEPESTIHFIFNYSFLGIGIVTIVGIGTGIEGIAIDDEIEIENEIGRTRNDRQRVLHILKNQRMKKIVD